jgi:hypothetical protein
MSKTNVKNGNAFVVLTIAAMLAMAAITATVILSSGQLYAQEEDAQEFTAERPLLEYLEGFNPS